MLGHVKWFNTKKGYGFIEPIEGSKDVFFHITQLEKIGLRNVPEGQKIVFRYLLRSRPYRRR